MKQTLAVLLSSAAICQAALIPFGLSPAGSSTGTGLSPANVVPAVTNSSGSGGPISGGLVFDTDASQLMVTIGYGSAAGFTDLTGAATNLTLNGPAATNHNAGVLFDLSTFSFPAVKPARGGVIFGSVIIPTNAVGDLMAGDDYITIGTETNQSGEIRGQLISLLPTVTCPSNSTVQCGTPASVSVQVSSPAGNAITAVWSLNGNAVQTNQVPASHPPVSSNIVFKAELPLGTNDLEVVATDSMNNSASCDTTVTVVDTSTPTITNASPSVKSLWPPNHKMVTVTITAKVTDSCGSPKWRITKVQSNESVNAKGSGNTSPDWIITGDHTVMLRAERTGTGSSSRIYTITIQAKNDNNGNLSAPATVTVTVPHNQGGH